MKKLITLVTLFASISAMANTVNCVNMGQGPALNIDIELDDNVAFVRDNATGDIDQCTARDLGLDQTLVTCSDLYVRITSEETRYGWNSTYSKVSGGRGYLFCE